MAYIHDIEYLVALVGRQGVVDDLEQLLELVLVECAGVVLVKVSEYLVHVYLVLRDDAAELFLDALGTHHAVVQLAVLALNVLHQDVVELLERNSSAVVLVELLKNSVHLVVLDGRGNYLNQLAELPAVEGSPPIGVEVVEYLPHRNIVRLYNLAQVSDNVLRVVAGVGVIVFHEDALELLAVNLAVLFEVHNVENGADLAVGQARVDCVQKLAELLPVQEPSPVLIEVLKYFVEIKVVGLCYLLDFLQDLFDVFAQVVPGLDLFAQVPGLN